MGEANHSGKAPKEQSATDQPAGMEPAGDENLPVEVGVVEEPAEAAAQPSGDKVADLNDQLLRLRADFDNYRKRTVRDREEQAKRAAERILSDLLPVLDHFELGLEQARKHHVKHAVIDGLTTVFEQLCGVLARAGVEEIATAGQAFDPRQHECVGQAPSDKHAEDTIVAQTRRGYKIGQYVLRASQVIVSKGSGAGGVATGEHRNSRRESAAEQGNAGAAPKG